MRWTTSKTAVYNIGYHLIWCPKYRRRVLITPIDADLKTLLSEKAKELGCIIDTIEVMPDHVHLFVKTTPNIAPQNLVKILKGYSSFALRNKYPWLKTRLPCLWTRSYYCESVGHISADTVKKYINEQKNK
jgi:putative transposase